MADQPKRTSPGSMRIPLFTMALLALSACSWTSRDGTHHTIAVGIAILSSKSVGAGTACVTRSNVIGIAFQTGSRHCLTLGYQSLQEATINPNWTGVITVTSHPGEPLTVCSLPVRQPSAGPSPRHMQ